MITPSKTPRFRWIVSALIFTLVFSTFVNFMSLLKTIGDANDNLPYAEEVRRLGAVGALDPPLNGKNLERTLESLKQKLPALAAIKTAKRTTRDLEIVEEILKDKNLNSESEIATIIRLGRLLERYIGTSHSERKKSFSESSSDKDKDGGVQKITLHPVARFPLPDSREIPHFELDDEARERLERIVRLKLKQHLIHLNSSLAHPPAPLMVHKDVPNPRNWQLWHNHITTNQLYDPQDPAIDALVHDLADLPIQDLSTMGDYGTQIKMVFHLSDGSRALFKPMRFSRETETLPNHYYFDDYERHTAEIGAFHLDRILEFYRVPPVSGRIVNITRDIQRFAPRELNRTIYISPAKNKCFYGKCDYYCDSGHSVCGTPDHPDIIEGAMAAWLPPGRLGHRKGWENPWGRSYSKFDKSEWQTSDTYCNKVRNEAPNDSGRRLLDIMDISIFDYLTGNMDRHHFHTFKRYGNLTSPLLYDNGRAFGKAFDDEESILVPLVQCCIVRYSTVKKFVALLDPPNRLSDLMRTSLARDPVSVNAPVLTEPHLLSLDRRLRKVLKRIHLCMRSKGTEHVIKDDGY